MSVHFNRTFTHSWERASCYKYCGNLAIVMAAGLRPPSDTVMPPLGTNPTEMRKHADQEVRTIMVLVVLSVMVPD